MWRGSEPRRHGEHKGKKRKEDLSISLPSFLLFVSSWFTSCFVSVTRAENALVIKFRSRVCRGGSESSIRLPRTCRSGVSSCCTSSGSTANLASTRRGDARVIENGHDVIVPTEQPVRPIPENRRFPPQRLIDWVRIHLHRRVAEVVRRGHDRHHNLPVGPSDQSRTNRRDAERAEDAEKSKKATRDRISPSGAVFLASPAAFLLNFATLRCAFVFVPAHAISLSHRGDCQNQPIAATKDEKAQETQQVYRPEYNDHLSCYSLCPSRYSLEVFMRSDF